MSYSYIETTFPHFKYTNVYDTKIYNDIIPKSQEINKNQFVAFSQDENYISNIQQQNAIEKNIEKFENNKQLKDEIVLEKIENKDEHTKYTNHVLNCSICKEMVLRQLNVESDRLFKEEILEIISYIVFGIFMLMLLDSK